jgi:hypothetical protein
MAVQVYQEQESKTTDTKKIFRALDDVILTVEINDKD